MDVIIWILSYDRVHFYDGANLAIFFISVSVHGKITGCPKKGKFTRLYELVPGEREHLPVEIVDGGSEKEHRADHPPEIGHSVFVCHLLCVPVSMCSASVSRPLCVRPFRPRTAIFSRPHLFLWAVRYPRTSAMIFRESAQSFVTAAQSPAFTTSFGKRLLPIPTQEAPALNQPRRFSASGFTPPVTRN